MGLRRSWLLLLVLLIMLAGSPVALSQTRTEQLVGTVSLIHGDTTPENPSESEHLTVALLKTDDDRSYQLKLQPEQMAQLTDGAEVTLEVPRGATSENLVPVENVLDGGKRDEVKTQSATQGPIPYVNLLCKFQGDSEPPNHNRDYFARMVQSLEPHTLRWIWLQFGVDIRNSDSLFQWVTLPRPKNDYLVYDPVGNWWVPKFDLVRGDCVEATRQYIGFERYKGINFVFSSQLGCCFWGGRNYPVRGNDGMTRLYNMTMGDGSYGWWPAFMVHEMGHSLPADAGERGLSHTHDQAGKMGNIFDPMSQPAAFCTDRSGVVCSGQGMTLPQLKRLGNMLPTKVIGVDEIGVFEADVNCLYGELASGYVRGVEIYFADNTRLSIEARCGGKTTPDFKLDKLSGIVALHVNENYHDTPDGKFQDLLLCWEGACNQSQDDIAGRGKKLEQNGVTLEVTGETNAGFHVQINRRGNMRVIAYATNNFQVWVIAENIPASARLENTIGVGIVVDNAPDDGKPTKVFAVTLGKVPTAENTAIWVGALPCVKGTHAYEVRANILGIEAENDANTITCAGQVFVPIARR